MELNELRVFLTVSSERSFSRAAIKLHRTQPAVSQAVRRLETSVGELLFDRATKDASLTDAGRLLRDYAERLLRLSEEAEAAVRDLRDLRRGRVLLGANEASVHAVLPLVARFRDAHPMVHVDVRRVRAREIGAAVAQGTLDFGVLTFQPVESGLDTLVLGQDELVMLVHPSHPLAGVSEVTLAECARQTVIAHNDPSHVRDRVLRLFEQHHIPANILVSLPSLEGIQRAVAMQMGVALLPRRSAAGNWWRWPYPRSTCAARSGSSSARPANALTRPGHSCRSCRSNRRPDADGCGQKPATYGSRSATACTSSNRSRSRPVVSHAPDTKASRTLGGSDTTTLSPSTAQVPSESEMVSIVSGRASTRSISALTSAGLALTHGRPIITELPKKMSENDSPMMARIPHR